MHKGWGSEPRGAWQNVLTVEVTDLPKPDVLQDRLDEVNRDLGSTSMRVLHHRSTDAMREELAGARSGSTVSAGLTYTRLVIAAHHLYVDGLGMLAVLGRLSGHPIGTSLDLRPSPTSTLPGEETAGPASPPARVALAHYRDDLLADVFASIRVRGQAPTVQLLAAAAAATHRYNARREMSAGHVQLTLAAFDADGSAPSLGVGSTLLQVPDLSVHSPDQLTELLPGAPRQSLESIASRSGHVSTMMAVRLGALDLPAAVRSVAFYPAAGTSYGVAIGAATEGEHTILTARSRASRHTAHGLQELLELIRNALL